MSVKTTLWGTSKFLDRPPSFAAALGDVARHGHDDMSAAQ
jgi:hypothetical protein